MNEQQYRVIANRDKGDDPRHADVQPGDRYTLEAVEGFPVVRIERPVATEHCLSTAHHAAHNWGANPNVDGGVWCPGFDASDELPTPHLPTREQIAAVRVAQAHLVTDGHDEAARALDAVLVQSPPPPTREQIAAAIHAHSYWRRTPWGQKALASREAEAQAFAAADAVLALVQNGAEHA